MSTTHKPAATNLLGDALTESREHFRQLVGSLDRLIVGERMDEARTHLPKLEALAKELHRLLNPRDPVDRKVLQRIDRETERLRKALKKGWGGAVGAGLAAMVVGGMLGIAALAGILWMAFS